jgi:hypothetical protein
MELVSKVSFFYSADLRISFTGAAIFPSRKKSITLLTCYIIVYQRTIFIRVDLTHESQV